MRVEKTTTVEQVKVASRFENLRKILSSEQYSHHLDKPLAYWALPSDRRLPLVFLGRKLGELLQTPFSELSATPGVGQKKIRSFVKLLSRAANTDPVELALEPGPLGGNGDGIAVSTEKRTDEANERFDPSTVSEVVWSKWRASVVRHGLGHVTLGRLAHSLKSITRVSWNTPLDNYTGYRLSEIRAMKTHGEKRTRAILEVFFSVHRLVAGMGTQDHLVVRICHRRIDAVQQWVAQQMQRPGAAGEAEIFDGLVHPLLEQLHVDATRQIASLAENRLGVSSRITSVREAARNMGLTRARVYQLLNEVNDIMMVRWPGGRCQVYELHEKSQAAAVEMENPPNLAQFRAAVELFYPSNRGVGNAHIDQIGQPDANGGLLNMDE